jgi:hypothetical protein
MAYDALPNEVVLKTHIDLVDAVQRALRAGRGPCG